MFHFNTYCIAVSLFTQSNLLRLFFDFLLVMPPLLSPLVLPARRQGWPRCSSHLHSGQNTKPHLVEEHSALWLRTLRGGEGGTLETGLGLEHSGHRTICWPGVSLLPCSTNSLCRTLEGETTVEVERFLSLLAAEGEFLFTSCIALLGEILLGWRFEIPTFSLSLFICEMKESLLSLWMRLAWRALLQLEETCRV